MAQYQDTIARLSLRRPTKRDILEIANSEIFSGSHRASMLDELTVDRESPLHLAEISSRRRSTAEEEARQNGHSHVAQSLQGCHHLGTRGGLDNGLATVWAGGRTVTKV